MENNIIHIAICFDNNYYKYGLILIESILKFNKNNKIFFHLVLENISFNQEKVIFNLINVSTNEFKRYYIPESLKALFENKNLLNHLSFFNRYLLMTLIESKIKKIIYLDSDTLVNEDLIELWNIELENYDIGAVLDAYLMEYEKKKLSKVFDGKIDYYFNSGVMVLKPEFWKKTENLKRFIEEVYKHNTYFADQHAANILFKGKTLFLPLKFNLMHIVSELPINRFEYIW